ncbi:Kef-type potassium/proton antiporter (CPA2 family) [Pacificibacter maritimus]|uniref:Kef-type potassium/proton antiporter (CPA2 family) n=1 Tax=Pacificibacter maritimus TaxID=762213 RepID=A0A3N4UMX8_9RHOB|nr:monovalent cation:proton antiporter-2 (CPA2) family protein [Pacificibacter maritimus]RPE71962.1 Kef-type potassium/proton antiporter (CPA2 family) [Pacificibacter maritimus]
MLGILTPFFVYLCAIVIAVPLARRLGLGSVLGYLLAGIVIGPILGLIQHNESEDLMHFAEFGVVMMLFLIGLELDPRALWDMRHKLVGLGGLQISLTVGAVACAGVFLGLAWQTALALGMILSLSSTAVVLQTLSEKNLMQTGGGRASFSVLLTQDIAVIPMIAILPLLAISGQLSINLDGSISRPSDIATQDLTWVQTLPGWGVTLVTLGSVGLIVFAGTFLARPFFRFIHGANLRELHTAVALFIVVGIALLMSWVGLSPALGTFLAGVVLANTEFRHELESSIEPFKGLLLGLFFIAVGAGINFSILFRDPLSLIGLTLGLMLLKGAILLLIGRLFSLRTRGQWLFALSLAQAGEFGMVLTSFALQQNVIDIWLGERLMVIIALSLLFTPLFFIFQDYLRARLSARLDDGQAADEIDDKQKIIIAGIGRFGQVVNRLVRASGFETTVVDHDLNTIQVMRKFGIKGFFGDPTRPDLLHAAGIDDAKILVVALDDSAAATKLVRYARKANPDLFIIVRARDRIHVYELFQAGADKIVREMFDSSLRAGRYVLEQLGLSDYDAAMSEKAYYQHDRTSLQDLAKLWDPSVPLSQNAAYVERSKSLDKELESALVAQMHASDLPDKPDTSGES